MSNDEQNFHLLNPAVSLMLPPLPHYLETSSTSLISSLMKSNSFSRNPTNSPSDNHLNWTMLSNPNSYWNITPSTQPPSYSQSASVSLGFVALINIIPVFFTPLTLISWHIMLWRKTSCEGWLPISPQHGHVTMLRPPSVPGLIVQKFNAGLIVGGGSFPHVVVVDQVALKVSLPLYPLNRPPIHSVSWLTSILVRPKE